MPIPEREGLLRANVWKMYVFEFFQNLHFFSAVLIPFFTVWGGIRFSQVMLLQAVFTFSMFLFEVPTGAVADRFGRKTSLVLSGLVSGCAALLYASCPRFEVFLAAEVLFAVGMTLSSGADQALLYDTLKALGEESGSKRVFARWNTVSLAGMMAAAPVGGLIAQRFGLRAPMFATAAAFFAMGLWACALAEPQGGSPAREGRYLETLLGGLRYFMGHRTLRALAFDFISIQTAAFFLIWLYQVVLRDYGVGLGWFGWMHAAILLGQSLVLNGFARLERFAGGKKRYLFATSAAVAAAYLLVALSRGVWPAVLGVLAGTAFGLTRKSLFDSYFNKFIGSEDRATVLSAISMLRGLTAAGLNVVFGFLVDWDYRRAALLMACAAIGLGALSRVEEADLRD